MEQIEIQFFWPLTEQIPLDLDFTESDECSRERFRKEIVYVLNHTGEYAVTPSTTYEIMPTPKCAGYWLVNGRDFQISREKRPSWLNRKLNKLLIGWEWKDI
jgi:hypothetical protein